MQVKDCIEAFVETRDHMRRMYRWVVVLGEPEPKSDAEQRFFLQEMKALEEQGGWSWQGGGRGGPGGRKEGAGGGRWVERAEGGWNGRRMSEAGCGDGGGALHLTS